jgi:hypothetical protein
MTEDEVDRQLRATPAGDGRAWPADPAQRLRTAEALADRRPADRKLASLVALLHGQATAGDQLPPDVFGVRREALVRWDYASTTWEGRRPDGGRAMVRVARPWAARDPSLRRALLRDAAALGSLFPGLAADDGEWPALALSLPGPGLTDDEDDAPAPTPARSLATAIAELARWESAGIGLPRLSSREIRQSPSRLSIACLTPSASDPAIDADNLSLVAELLVASEHADDALHERLVTLAAAPPSSASEAASWLASGFAEALSAERHGLARRWRDHARKSRTDSLRGLIQRLDRALSPPEGRGAVGVDLDGRTTVLVSGPSGLRWGPAASLEAVWTREEGFDPQLGRRLLRAWAAVPPSPRLQVEVGGSADWVEGITRWVAAGLKLRTLRLLLERAER